MDWSEIIRLTEHACLVSRFHSANSPRGIIIILRHWRENFTPGFSDYEFTQCPDPLKYAANFLYTVRWIKFTIPLPSDSIHVIYILLNMMHVPIWLRVCLCVCVCARGFSLFRYHMYNSTCNEQKYMVISN